MRIERLSGETLKIQLSNEEMQSLGVNYEILKTDSVKAKRFFSLVFSFIGDTDIHRVYIELFDLKEGGLVIYASKLPEREGCGESQIFITAETKSVEKLTKAASTLVKSLEVSEIKSRLYFKNGLYRLVMIFEKKPDSKLAAQLSGELSALKYGRLITEVTDEHWEKLIPKNALERLSELS